MSDFSPEQSQVPPQNPSTLRYEGQVTEKPMAVWVFGVLNIVAGCYQLIDIFLLFFQIEAIYKNSCTINGLSYLLLGSGISVGLSIWLIVLGIGLLRMKKWSRRGSVIYAWVQIGLGTVTRGYIAFIILSGLANAPKGFWITYAYMMLAAFVYPILLLIFMSTQKVKRAFTGIVG